ncbi:AAA family ATPase [Rhodococcus qingshengii]|uniref:AAA family ATPase n=1 Tax=Rhodococcus qingshengii TaxID=334542 RepID=UPI0021B0B839|nr:AAA family ATPase [Rhodococcus qingshengii]MCT6735372.1 AAA family ATPase [Rhodococcus qingshengii]
MIDQSQIVDTHFAGLTAIGNGNKKAAYDHFAYALRKDTTECDIFRGVAACAPDAVAVDDIVFAIYLTRSSFGNLTHKAMIKAADEDNRGLPAGAQRVPAPSREECAHIPNSVYSTGFFAVEIPLTFVGNVFAAMAAVHVNRREFDQALKVLDNAPQDLATVQLVRAMLYYRAERWPEVIESAEPLRSAAMRDHRGHVIVDGGAAVPNVMYQQLSYLLSGTALAHLDNEAAATTSFQALQDSTFNQIGTEAFRMLGLIARGNGDEKRAQDLFGAGLAMSKSEELERVQADATQYLRLTSREMISQRTDPWDVRTEPSLAAKKESDKEDHRAALLARADTAMKRQIGMKGVKAQIDSIRQSLRVEAEYRRRGIDVGEKSLHMMLMGPPGTGKTTIARVFTDYLGGIGVIREPKLVEVTRSDLVGETWGSSGPKTEKVIQSALGGVLFIDEAYDLVQTNKHQTDPLGQEAVNKLLTYMENHRDDLVVIIAGYEEDLRAFLATNAGLKSRFTKTIVFETYSPEEIADIAEVTAQGKNQILSPEAKATVVENVSNMVGQTDPGTDRPLIDTAGNGRFARTIVETATAHKNNRFAQLQDLSKLSEEDLQTLTDEDVRLAIKEIVDGIL